MEEDQLRLIVQGDIPMRTGDAADGLESIARARLLANDTADLERAFDEVLALDLGGRPDASLLVATMLHHRRGPVERSRALALGALDTYSAGDDSEGMALAQLLLGHLCWWEGDMRGAAKWWDAAADLPVAIATPAGLAPFRVVLELWDHGDYGQVVPQAQHAYAVALAEGTTLDEGNATLISGLVLTDIGELDRATDTLLRAHDLFTEVEPESLAALWPLVPLGLAEIAARRGQIDQAVLLYAEARDRAERLGRPGLHAVACAMPATHLPYQPDLPWPIADTLADAQAAVDALQATISHPFLLQYARRGVAAALLASGEASRALEAATACADDAFNPLARAKSLMLVGAARRALGRPDLAADAFDEALDAFVADHTDLWAVEALLELADTRADDASESLERAYRLTHDDDAFARLWSRRPKLLLEVVPGHRPRFQSGDAQLRLGTTGAELAAIVIRSGETGVHWETVAADLWPEDEGTARIKSRITSLTALVRKRLGTEAWRLRRDGARFSFILLQGDRVVAR